MARYQYQALDSRGGSVRGIADAPSLLLLAEKLREQACFLLKAREIGSSDGRPGRGVLSAQDRIDFTDQLSLIVKSGIPLVSGLREIGDEAVAPALKAIVTQVVSTIQDGHSLAEALAEHPRAFDQAYVSAVRAGEETGRLDEVMSGLSRQLGAMLETRRQVITALIQPAFLMLAIGGLITMVMVLLLPAIQEVSNREGTELPWVTSALMAVSEFLRAHRWVWAITLLVGIFGTRPLLRRPGPAILMDRSLARVPVIGRVRQLAAASRFVNIFGLLQGAGVTIDRNLAICEGVTGSPVLGEGLRRMRSLILDGSGLADSARESGVLPPLVVRVLRIGEQTGQLPEALERAREYYDRELARALKRIVTVLQPTLVVAGALAVAFVVFAAFLPILNLASGGLR